MTHPIITNRKTCEQCIRPGYKVPAPGAVETFVRRCVRQWQESLPPTPADLPGKLTYSGTGTLGPERYAYVKCETCFAQFPVIDKFPSCNGHKIELCPWCRPDSAPWKDGRGL